MYLIFDTETTGKPRDYKASYKDVDNWPRITQLAFQVYNSDGSLCFASAQLIKPDGWEIPKTEFFIKNNMSTERCEEFGVPIQEALKDFLFWLDDCKYIVAHNLNFDKPIVQAEMFRLGMKSTNRPEGFCTMISTTDLLQIPGPYGFKYPGLMELHEFLFGCKFEGAHDAGDDVTATGKCFFELIKRGVF